MKLRSDPLWTNVFWRLVRYPVCGFRRMVNSWRRRANARPRFMIRKLVLRLGTYDSVCFLSEADTIVCYQRACARVSGKNGLVHP